MTQSDRAQHLGPLADSTPEQAEEVTAERLAKEADGIIRRLERARAKAWSDWMALAERLAGISRAAMRLSGANMRGGRGYSEMMSHLLRKHHLGEPKWKQTRAALLNIWENRADVEAMRARWDHDQQLKWQAPTTVWDKFSHRQKADDPRPRGQSTSAATRSHVLADLQEENDRLKQHIRELEAGIAELGVAELASLLFEQWDREALDALITALTAGTDDNAWPLTVRPQA